MSSNKQIHKEIIQDLDSNNEEIQERGKKKLKEYPDIDVTEIQRMSKMCISSETIDKIGIIFLTLYLSIIAVVILFNCGISIEYIFAGFIVLVYLLIGLFGYAKYIDHFD